MFIHKAMAMYAGVLSAAERISHAIHKTPVLTCSTLDSLVGRSVFLKCENLQKTGSFKARGALNAVLKLKEENASCPGVVGHSSGNHGQGLAWAARKAGLSCTVVVPNITSTVKMDAIRGYGAELVLCENTPQARMKACMEIAETTGKVFIPPSDHYDVIAGQGTIAVELLEQVPDLDAILVPTSGGGMVSGISIAAKGIRPSTKVFAVEPTGKDLERSLKAGKRMWEGPPRILNTIADGIRLNQIEELTFPIMLEHTEKEVFTVSDEEMVKAMKFTFQYTKLVIEISSAAGMAAVMSEHMQKMDPSLKKVGVVLCGGNADINNLPW